MKVDLSGANWFESRRSTAAKDCVEVAFLSGGRPRLDESRRRGARIRARSWAAFTARLSGGTFDR